MTNKNMIVILTMREMKELDVNYVLSADLPQSVERVGPTLPCQLQASNFKYEPLITRVY